MLVLPSLIVAIAQDVAPAILNHHSLLSDSDSKEWRFKLAGATSFLFVLYHADRSLRQLVATDVSTITGNHAKPINAIHNAWVSGGYR